MILFASIKTASRSKVTISPNGYVQNTFNSHSSFHKEKSTKIERHKQTFMEESSDSNEVIDSIKLQNASSQINMLLIVCSVLLALLFRLLVFDSDILKIKIPEKIFDYTISKYILLMSFRI